MQLFDGGFWLGKIVLPVGGSGGAATTPLELLAMALTLACVFLTVRLSLWCWPVGIVASVAYGLLFLHLGLLADTYLQVFFVGTSAYGWHWWLRGGPGHDRLPISALSPRQKALWTLATVATVASVGYVHANFTQARLPYLDALASGGSVTAQLLMMRKKSECWPLWIAVDALSIYIYVATQVVLTAILYALLLALAALGWYQWTQESRLQSPSAEA